MFDIASLPASWELGYHAHGDNQVSLARAHDALKSLASGELKAVDPKSFNPYDTESSCIDRAPVEYLLWLLNDNGVSQKQLKHRQPPVSATPKEVSPPGMLRSLEVCAGAGGQALGLHAACFQALGLYERDKSAAETLQSNHKLGPVRCADITKVDFTPYRGKVDLVAGGVPCQGHSSAGNQKGREDERDLFLEAVRIVGEV